MAKRSRFTRYSMHIAAATIVVTLVALSTLTVRAEPAGQPGRPALYPAYAAAVSATASDVETQPPEPFTERYPWLLAAVVTMSTALIGLFIASLVQQVRRNLAPPDPPDCE